MTTPLIPPHIVASGAFRMLAASTYTAFERAVEQHFIASAVALSLAAPEPDILVARIKDLWSNCMAAAGRSEFEVELSILLYRASQIADVRVDDLLTQISIRPEPQVAWIAALSRNLLARRRSDRTIVLGKLGDAIGGDKSSAKAVSFLFVDEFLRPVTYSSGAVLEKHQV